MFWHKWELCRLDIKLQSGEFLKNVGTFNSGFICKIAYKELFGKVQSCLTMDYMARFNQIIFLILLTVFKSGTYDSSLKGWLVVVVDVDCLFWWSLMSDQVSLKWGEVWAIYGWIIGWIVLVHDWTFFLDVGDLLIGKYWNVRIIRLSWFKTFEMSMVRPTWWMI